MNIDDFYLELLEQIRTTNDSYKLPSEQSLFRIFFDFLQESGQFVDDVMEIEYGFNGYNFSAFSKDIERSQLHLFVTLLKSENKLPKIYQKDLDEYSRGLIKLIEKNLIPGKNQIDESNPICEFINDLESENRIFRNVNIWLITNGIYSSRSLTHLNAKLNNLECNIRIVDLAAYRNMLIDINQKQIEIECNLDALKVIETNYYTSFLTAVSANDLVRYYDQFGKRLLESNVRTFLSIRGEVNKGIYHTLKSDEKVFFFAYNNGLSGTASDVDFRQGKIKFIRNLQIVNGGQTMSTIYKAKRDGFDLDNVEIQMKLSVIHDKENYTKYVSKISEYANTQNKVNKSDFFSNSYFHKRFKEISKVLRVPATKNKLISTKWYYERVKGEYLNDQMYMKDSERTKFLSEYPKDQVIDKILISKANLSWEIFPYEVSKGAQLCFAKFAEKVSGLYHESDPDCNEFLFQKVVCQVILFKEVESLVSSASWYSGGYRAQTVPYIISILSYKLSQTERSLNWEKIWVEQKIEQKLLDWLNYIGEKVHKRLIIAPEGNTNVGTFCKNKMCWDNIKNLTTSISDIPSIKSIVDLSKETDQKTKSRKNEWLNNGISTQIQVIELSRTLTPKKILEFYNSKYSPGITDLSRSVLKSWYEGKILNPTEKQAKIIMDLIKKAIDAGFTDI
jgi:hypothetical protein